MAPTGVEDLVEEEVIYLWAYRVIVWVVLAAMLAIGLLYASGRDVPYHEQIVKSGPKNTDSLLESLKRLASMTLGLGTGLLVSIWFTGTLSHDAALTSMGLAATGIFVFSVGLLWEPTTKRLRQATGLAMTFAVIMMMIIVIRLEGKNPLVIPAFAAFLLWRTWSGTRALKKLTGFGAPEGPIALLLGATCLAGTLGIALMILRR